MFVGRVRGDQAEFRRVFHRKTLLVKLEIKKRFFSCADLVRCTSVYIYIPRVTGKTGETERVFRITANGNFSHARGGRKVPGLHYNVSPRPGCYHDIPYFLSIIVDLHLSRALTHARTQGGCVTRTRARRKPRDIVTQRASRRVFFALVAFKRPLATEGKKGGREHLRTNVGLYPEYNTKRPRW